MRHFRAEEEKYDNQSLQKLPFQTRLQMSLKNITKLLLFAQFAVNYGYAIENVWVTMLMITHNSPDIVESFVWVTPIILAIIIRPYIIRYVHQLTYKVYRQVWMVSLFLILGGIGCYIVGLSCSMPGKSKMARRIWVCSIGWTLMDISFEFCQFFAAKVEESLKNLQSQKEEGKEVEVEHQHFGKKQNFQFYGLFLGYIVSLLICWVVHGRSVKEFYRCCKYAYWTVGGLALITGIRLFIQSSSSMPQKEESQDKQNPSKVLAISAQSSFYLPGLLELMRSDKRTFMLLVLHGVIVFQNDIITVYGTMWFSEPDNYKFKKHGEALIAGLQFGSLALLSYTIIDALKVGSNRFHSKLLFEVSLGLMFLVSLYSFWQYNYLSFALVCIMVGIVNQFYRHLVYNHEVEENPIFQRCIQIVERVQKIFVFAVMPPIVLLLLERDDVRDCILWYGGMSLLGLILYRSSRKMQLDNEDAESSSGTVKVTKIQ